MNGIILTGVAALRGGCCGAIAALLLMGSVTHAYTRSHTHAHARTHTHVSRYPGIIAPAVLVHGTFDFQQLLLMVAVTDETLQTVLVIFLDAAVLIGAAVLLWWQLKGLATRQALAAYDQMEEDGPGGRAGDGVRLLPVRGGGPREG